jgi:ADP-ribosylation factor-like protein 13B
MYTGVVASAGDENIQYGVKAVRQLKRVKNSELLARDPTQRMRHKQAVVFEYFRREVDPIIESCVTFLLCSKPVDTSGALLQFLNNRLSGGSGPFKLPEKTQKTTKEHKIYLAHHIGPIVTRLVAELSKVRPKNVVSFMRDEVAKIVEEEKANPAPSSANAGTKSPRGSNNQQHKQLEWSTGGTLHSPGDKRPSTAEGIVSPRSPSKSSNNQSTADVAYHEVRPARPGSAPPGGIHQFSELGAKEVQIAVLGIAGAGKTSFINTLQGQSGVKVRPTMGFRPVTMMLGNELKIRFYDLGGGKRLRDIWEQYYHDVHGFVFLVDSSSNATDLCEAADVFSRVKSHDYLRGKPGLVLANKQDMKGAESAEVITNILNCSNDENIQVKESYCFHSVEDGEENVFQVADPRVESALLSLLHAIRADYGAIDDRVRMDTAKKDVEEAKKRLQRERAVLRNKIACAFPDQVDLSVPGVDVSTANPNDNFGEVDGLKFLAGEVGVEVDKLDPIAREVAALIGYQRLPLQMVGALNVPVSKKKTPMEWREIKELIISLRVELGLPPTVV